jgi:GTP-binding protein
VKFVDVCRVKVHAGQGGNGAVAFRREKYVPFGGPSGGDGGRGGDVVFRTDPGISTLLDLTYAHSLRAKDGQNGQGADCYGRGADDLVCRVPVGTQVFDEETGELLFDLTESNKDTIVAKGGRGGRGNIHFATPLDRAPRRAEPGEPGEEKSLRLELKVMADVGLLGFPNVGKSTFVAAVSRARPKIADYPFTTLVPQLGVVRIDEDASFVIADIPGLIPGAAEGAGLGIRFLQHVERTRALLHLITLDPSEGREPMADYDALLAELRSFDPELAKRPTLVALAKADIPEVREAYEDLRARFAKRRIELHLISAATGEGMLEMQRKLYHLIHRRPEDLEELEAELPSEPEATTESAPTTSAAKKAAKKAALKMAASKKSTPKKTAKMAASKKSTPKKAAKKAASKKSTPKKAAKKAASKKSTPKKAASKKSTPKKATKKVSLKKTAKKTASKKAAPKKIAKKAASKKAAPKKTAKKAAAKKSTPRKAAPKKTAKKVASKKSTPKKASKKSARR